VGLVALVVIVIVISAAVGIPKFYPVVGGKSSASEAKESEARRKLVSEAVTASNAAIDDKALANKILLGKTRAEKSAAANAAADPGASQKVADNAKTELVNAEASASKADIKALAAMAAARDTIQRAQGEPQFGWVGWTLLSLLLGGLFPLSAWAFLWLEVSALVAQVKHDCDLLGSPSLEATSSTSSTSTRDPDPFARRWHWASYLIHCSVAVFATLLGAALFFRQPDALLDVNTQGAMQFGFLGAYVYCMNLVYRRYTTLDLQPHVFMYCAVGLIAGMVFNYVAFTAITNIASTPSEPDAEFKGIGAGVAAIMAFSLGYFPNLAIRWFGRISRTSVHERQRRSDALPLSLIDGISELHESRLQDEGIDNVQNLAAANIRDLVIKTPFSAQGIVEWTDQAVLYLYLDPGEIESFRRAGVRTVSDFCDIWEGFSVRYEVQSDGTFKQIPCLVPDDLKPFEERRKALAQQLATTEQRLDSLFRATQQGPNMGYVRTYLGNVQTAAVQARTLFIDQICGLVGRTVRENVRSGDSPPWADILTQVAEEMFLAAAQFDNKKAVGLTAESLYGRAYLMNRLGRIADARQLYKQCTEKFPKDPVAYNDLAWLDLQTLFQKSAFETARANAQKAVDLASRLANAVYDLRLMLVDAADNLLNEGCNLVIVALVGTDLHIRIFDANGKRVVDKAENELISGETLTALKKQLNPLPDESGLSQEQKQKFIGDATSIAGHPPNPTPPLIDPLDLPGYQDTLALAEIRLGNIEKGEGLVKKAIEDWGNLGRGPQPRFLETLVSAAEAYLSKNDRAKAKEVLDFVVGKDYVNKVNKETGERIKQLQQKLAAPGAPANPQP